ncbi:hypothetical protein EUGRSUZ_C01738 [Eucalyptus grandis]|uniref:Uncharacterized protein n=2 Tax=Eucalyptus grandis TaxID=71139 RepID=A0ACC3LDP3_EUCGR|nr:hypothetical protein EUGRSUZ_C01738 [Eucalyptus grandis]
MIKEEVRKVVSKVKAAGVLRLVFHDAGTFEMSENSGILHGQKVKVLQITILDISNCAPYLWLQVLNAY